MDLNERLEKLNQIRLKIIEIEGKVHKLEFRREENCLTDLDINGIGHLLFGQDNAFQLSDAEIYYLRHCLEKLVNDKLVEYQQQLQQLHQQAQALLTNEEPLLQYER